MLLEEKTRSCQQLQIDQSSFGLVNWSCRNQQSTEVSEMGYLLGCLCCTSNAHRTQKPSEDGGYGHSTSLTKRLNAFLLVNRNEQSKIFSNELRVLKPLLRLYPRFFLRGIERGVLVISTASREKDFQAAKFWNRRCYYTLVRRKPTPSQKKNSQQEFWKSIFGETFYANQQNERRKVPLKLTLHQNNDASGQCWMHLVHSP